MAQKIDIGTKVRVVGKFTKFDKTPGTTTALLRIIDPALAETTPTVTVDKQAEDGTTAEVGTMFGDVTLSQAGLWRYRWEGTGLIIAADEGSFRVMPSEFS